MYTIQVDETTMRLLCKVGKHHNLKHAPDALHQACLDAIKRINIETVIAGNDKFAGEAEDWQMHPSSFDEADAVFGPPQGMSEGEVFSLCAARIRWGDEIAVLTCWKPTQAQLDRIRETGRVWLSVMGHSMPPVALTSEKPTNFPGVNFQ